jgi:hypothetical protein
MNGPQNMPPDWLEQDEEEVLTIREALQNIVDSVKPETRFNDHGAIIAYRLDSIDFDNAVAALKRGV